MRSTWILALALSLSPLANASVSDQFREDFREALITLAKVQVQNLGFQKDTANPMPLALNLADQIKYVEVPNIEKPAGATRTTAMADCEEKTVYISLAAVSGNVPLPIVIHESLGALCVQDVNYEMTSILSLMIESKRSGFHTMDERNQFWQVSSHLLNHGGKYKNRFLEQLNEQSKIQTLNTHGHSGSITYIGSAGDEVAAQIKFLFLKDYIRWLNPEFYYYRQKIQQAYLNVKIERVDSYNGKIRFIRVLNPKSNYLDSFYFYVPKTMRAKQAALEIFNFMTTRLGYGPNFRARGYVPHLEN